MDSFDFVVVGAGPGGYVAAIRAAQLGLKVALIEKRAQLGGTCLNVGCIPSKALLESSELFHGTQSRLGDHGIQTSRVELDLKAMMARKKRIVKEITSGVLLLMKKNKITLFRGRGRLSGIGRVRIEGKDGEREIAGDRIVLALGSVPVEIPGLAFDGSHIVSSTEALAFDAVPERFVVVGAGAIGLELGSVWNRLGSRVTVLELLEKIAPFADDQLSRALQKSLAAQGMEFHLKSRVLKAERAEGEVKVVFKDAKGAEKSLTCDKLLVAVGRKPFTEGAGLEEAGVELDDQGRIRVDEEWKTTAKGVYAIGDVIQGPMLAHKAEEEGIAVAERAAGRPGHVNYDAVPNVIYTFPELAQVGITEGEAKERGVPCKAGRSYFAANGRAKSLGEEEGFVKIISHEETDRLLGVHILGPRASDLIAEAVVAMEFSGSSEDVARTCHAHPTLSEVMKEAAMALDRRSIHG